MWVDGSQMGSVEYSDRRIRTMKVRMIIMIRRMITMIMIIVKWSFRGRMCNFEYSYIGQWSTNVDFFTFVDCSNYITLEQLVALRWLYEMLL